MGCDHLFPSWWLLGNSGCRLLTTAYLSCINHKQPGLFAEIKKKNIQSIKCYHQAERDSYWTTERDSYWTTNPTLQTAGAYISSICFLSSYLNGYKSDTFGGSGRKSLLLPEVDRTNNLSSLKEEWRGEGDLSHLNLQISHGPALPFSNRNY